MGARSSPQVARMSPSILVGRVAGAAAWEPPPMQQHIPRLPSFPKPRAIVDSPRLRRSPRSVLQKSAMQTPRESPLFSNISEKIISPRHHSKLETESPDVIKEDVLIDTPEVVEEVIGDDWKCIIREGSFLEDWLNVTLQRAGPLPCQSEITMDVDADVTGLEQYGLSRVQLGSLGLSQSEVERAYRLLYVYSVGCHDILKELCIHSLAKSELLGCFWRAFIRLCEEHSKIGLQAEIAEMMEEKQKALEELRLVKGNLNKALDELSLKQLSGEKNLVDPHFQGFSIQEVEEKIRRLKELEDQIQVMTERCAKSDEGRLNLISQVEETLQKLEEAKLEEKTAIEKAVRKEKEKADLSALLEERTAQLQRALSREKQKVRIFQESSEKLQYELDEADDKRSMIELKLMQYEQEVPLLRKEIAEKKESVQRLERLLKMFEIDCSKLKEERAQQEMAIDELVKEVGMYLATIKNLRQEVKERNQVLEEKAQESLMTGREVDEWIRGHEVLLTHQQGLVVEVQNLRTLLGVERIERRKEKEKLETTVSKGKEAIHALAMGFLAVTPCLRPPLTNKRKPPICMPSRKVNNAKETRIRPDRRDSAVSPCPNLFTDESLDTRDKEILVATQEINMLQRSLKEEKDKRTWVERQMEGMMHRLRKLREESLETNARLANVTQEKKKRDQSLNLADKEILMLRRDSESLVMALEDRNKEVNDLKTALTDEVSDKLECKRLLGEGVKNLETQMASEAQLVANVVDDLKNVMCEIKEKWLCRISSNWGSWKKKADALSIANLSLLSEVRSLRDQMDFLWKRGNDLEDRLKEEEQSKMEAENRMESLMKVVSALRSMLKVLHARLAMITEQIMKHDPMSCNLKENIRDSNSNLEIMGVENSCRSEVTDVLSKDIDALQEELSTIKQDLDKQVFWVT